MYISRYVIRPLHGGKMVGRRRENDGRFPGEEVVGEGGEVRAVRGEIKKSGKNQNRK